MPGSSSLGYLSTGSTNPEVFRQALPTPLRLDIEAAPARSARKASAAPSTTRASPNVVDVVDVPERTLTFWNVAMFLFHAGLASLTFVVGNLDLRVPLFKTVIDFRFVNGTTELAEEDRRWELVPTYVQQGSLPFTVLVAIFFILSSTFHLLNATLLRSYYLAELRRCRTPTRWIEYTFSAPVMILIIAYTLGIRDRATLVAITVLVATTMPFGYWIEQAATPDGPDAWVEPLRVRLIPWFIGHVPQTAAWFLIVWQFYDGADTEDRTPAFVHAILWLEFVLFFSFGAASLWSQYVPPRRFYVGELLFQTLSLVSKGLLGGLLLANVLMLSRFEDLYEDAR